MTVITTKTASGTKRRRGLITRCALTIGKRHCLVAGLNEGVSTLQDHVFAINTKKMSDKAKRLDKKEKVKAYFASVFEFQLWYGDTAFGKPQKMTGKEAYEKNKALEDKFFKDKNPDARLWRWHQVGVPRVTKGMTAKEHYALRVAHSAKKQATGSSDK